jgi:hypothetical protein
MWTVILHFGRGHSDVHTGLTKDQAQQMVSIAVFNNRDCINCSIFLSEE